jgi:hypothetical protein
MTEYHGHWYLQCAKPVTNRGIAPSPVGAHDYLPDPADAADYDLAAWKSPAGSNGSTLVQPTDPDNL